MREGQPSSQETGLLYLFGKFLKIGSIAFGGFMALISIVQRELVEKDKKADNTTILDGISIASILPGPVAVNLITFLGYKLKGLKGGLISMLAVTIPSFILILVLSIIYFHFGNVKELNDFFDGVLPAVAAIILSVSIGMTRKNIRDWRQYIMAATALALVFFVGGFFITLIIVLSGGILGRVLFFDAKTAKEDRKKGEDSFFTLIKKEIILYRKSLIIGILAVGGLYFIPLIFKSWLPEYIMQLHSLLFTIGGVSVTLFGGGYVFIPLLQELVVDKLHWLTATEFIDGIALGQVTPGPIMISATFIGYKVAGIAGAVVGTIAIFLPPGLVIMACARFIDFFKQSAAIRAIFKGIHPVVIGMIFAACLIIMQGMPHDMLHFSIFILSFVLVFFVKLDLLIIIPAAGLIGLLFS